MLTSAVQQGFSSTNEPTPVLCMASQRDFAPICSAEPLAILSFRLSSIDGKGLPHNLVYHHVRPYLLQNIIKIDMPFDFSSQKGLKAYSQLVDKLVTRLTSGDLKRQTILFCFSTIFTKVFNRYKRFATYLTTHSDPERGDLHFASLNKGAAQVAEVPLTLHGYILLTRTSRCLVQFFQSV